MKKSQFSSIMTRVLKTVPDVCVAPGATPAQKQQMRRSYRKAYGVKVPVVGRIPTR